LKTCEAANLLGGQKITDIMARLSYTTSLEEGAKGAGFVLETVAENPDVKKDIFAQLENIVTPETIIASNASFLNVFNIAQLKHMDRLVVAHYYAPAHIIPLVEVVPGPQTSEATMGSRRQGPGQDEKIRTWIYCQPHPEGNRRVLHGHDPGRPG
jgi:3-hydroxyacyl-CoA dehydrogenase